MVKTFSTLCVLGLSIAAAFAKRPSLLPNLQPFLPNHWRPPHRSIRRSNSLL
jgi:hypothetical protein